MNRLILLCCVMGVVLSGCASGMRRTPVAGLSAQTVELLVFNDGFHSGIMAPFEPDLRWLDASDDGVQQYPWIEFGYAADDWVNASQSGCISKTKLAINGSPGILMLEFYPTFNRPPRNVGVPVKTWKLTVSRESWLQMVAALHEWTDLSIVRVRNSGEKRWFAFSTKRWTIARNCNDFVIECLRAGGIDSMWHLGYTADGFCRQMDYIEATLKKANVTVVGPLLSEPGAPRAADAADAAKVGSRP